MTPLYILTSNAMLSSRKQGFTLVELIVVVTILVILGTIAFISVEDMSKEAQKKAGNKPQTQTQTSTTEYQPVVDSSSESGDRNFILGQDNRTMYLKSYYQDGNCLKGVKALGGDVTVCGNYTIEQLK